MLNGDKAGHFRVDRHSRLRAVERARMSVGYKKSWVICLSGAHNAMRRLDDALSARKTDPEALRPLIECLWWVCAADESLMEEYPIEWDDHHRPKSSELYAEIQGLRWARNRVTHQVCHWNVAAPPFIWADAECLWPSAEIKTKNMRHRDKGRNEYIARLQGNDARKALNTVIHEIRNEALLLDPKQG